ncbi:hypothetical protein I7I48_01441 [Histoplasma ohiense]|nr:hypothetical protein I7I48_01441 [Histoplasma ohiense (nom. inval.)]
MKLPTPCDDLTLAPFLPTPLPMALAINYEGRYDYGVRGCPDATKPLSTPLFVYLAVSSRPAAETIAFEKVGYHPPILAERQPGADNRYW